MEEHYPEIKGKLIVLIGDFNPSIFNPVWFANEGLIRSQEAVKAEVQISHPDVSSFSLEWLRFNVTRTQLVIETMQEQYEEVIRDLALGTFRLLRHTPIKKMGINTLSHFKLQTEEQWHEIGHRFAPKEIWKKIFKNPGLKTIRIEDSPREDGYKGYIHVNVEPSTKVHPGLFFKINDHYEVLDGTVQSGSNEIMDILDKNWMNSCKKADQIIATIMGELS
jgi:hypothetical protein